MATTSLKQERFQSYLIMSNTKPSWPKSYLFNTNKEEVTLEYVENFRRQFIQLFPQRRPLPLCFTNECNVLKFVCTCIKPTTVPFITNHELTSCSQFLADYISYQPLEDATKLNSQLFSPSTIIAMQSADCLESSNVLVSMLRGYGFDAYVVSGTAPKWITECNQSLQTYPIECDDPLADVEVVDDKTAETATTMVDDEVNADNNVDPENNNDEKKDTSSNNDNEHDDDDDDNAAAAAAFTLEHGNEMEPERKKYEVTDISDYKSKFLETQEQREAKQKEAFEKEQDLRKTAAKLVAEDDMYGHRRHVWVLVKAGRRDVTHDVFIEASTGVIYALNKSPYIQVDSVWNERNYWVNVQSQELKMNELSFDVRNHNNWEYALIDTNDQVDATNETTPTTTSTLPLLDAPFSWCSPFTITRAMYNERYPGGSKIVNYYRCCAEMWCEFYEDGKGLIRRVTYYDDDDRQHINNKHEVYSRRKDKLRERFTYPNENRVHCMYDQGRKSGIKDYVEIKGQSRTLTFYPGSRIDGLCSRDEMTNFKVIERFEGRDDLLLYRSFTIANEEDEMASIGSQKGFVISIGNDINHNVRKITEKFERNMDKHAENDLRKRTHFIMDRTIRLDYHYDTRKITASRLLYNRQTETCIGHRVSEEYTMPTQTEVRQTLVDLLNIEKRLMSLIKDREREMKDMISELENDDNHVVLEKTIYDIANETITNTSDDNIVHDDDTTESIKVSTKDIIVDYLSPFIAQYPLNESLTRKQALKAREDCLKALRDQLLERANIITSHLEAEHEQLRERQAVHNRATSSGVKVGGEIDEEFTRFYEETMFRISILQARLDRHEQVALKKYADMDLKLRNDPRLSVLQQHNNNTATTAA